MFSIDSTSREPIYSQLEKSIVKYINFGIIEKGSQLPTVRALAFDLGINPNTVSKVYQNLEEKGIIYSISGKGVFVSEKDELKKAKEEFLFEIESTLKDAKNSGISKDEITTLTNSIWKGENND